MWSARVVAAGLVVAWGGCGRLGFEALDPVGRGDGGPSPDSGASCTFSPFGEPVRIAEVSSTEDDWLPRLSRDELTLWFMSWRAPSTGQSDIWTASRASLEDPFDAPTRVLELSSAGTEDGPSIERDGLTIYLSSNRSGEYELYVATRPDLESAWETPVRLDVDWPDVAPALRFPMLSPDELELYFAAGAAAPGGIRDIWSARRPDRSSPFSDPTPRDDLSHDGRDDTVAFSSDHLEVILASDRPGGEGGLDLWRATRPDVSSPFGPAENLGPSVNTSADEVGAFLSADGRRLYYNYDSSVSAGNRITDIWMATRDCEE